MWQGQFADPWGLKDEVNEEDVNDNRRCSLSFSRFPSSLFPGFSLQLIAILVSRL